MNIRQAKQQLSDTLRAYLAKDALGNYRIPVKAQSACRLLSTAAMAAKRLQSRNIR